LGLWAQTDLALFEDQIEESDNKMSKHIVAKFDEDLKLLGVLIAEMGGIAEEQLAKAVTAVVRRDNGLALQAIESDHQLDRLEGEVEAQVVKLLALRQPMAKDLREIISALKVSHNLERIGDFARNIAKRALTLNQLSMLGPARSVESMSQRVGTLLHEVVASYVDQDLSRALKARERDEEIDALYNSLFRELLTYMMESPQNITPCTHLMFIAKNLERIGDHATNMAETLHFVVKGHALEGQRPKGDDTAELTTIVQNIAQNP
jgi:phosphate transport system protein